MYTLTEALSDIVYHATSLTAGGATHCYPEFKHKPTKRYCTDMEIIWN